MPTREPCIFCEIVAGTEVPVMGMVREWPDAIAFVPLGPVADGHVLVVPRQHVADALEDPSVTAMTMARASELAQRDCNIITSAGPAATQTVFHLHLHIVPRSEGDGLTLPWTGQIITKPNAITLHVDPPNTRRAEDAGLAAGYALGRRRGAQ